MAHATVVVASVIVFEIVFIAFLQAVPIVQSENHQRVQPLIWIKRLAAKFNGATIAIVASVRT